MSQDPKSQSRAFKHGEIGGNYYAELNRLESSAVSV